MGVVIMKYLSFFLWGFILIGIFLMPAWISRIPKLSWDLVAKKVTLLMMVAVSIAFSIFVITRPNEHFISWIIGSAVTVVYLLVVFMTTYYSWPK